MRYADTLFPSWSGCEQLNDKILSRKQFTTTGYQCTRLMVGLYPAEGCYGNLRHQQCLFVNATGGFDSCFLLAWVVFSRTGSVVLTVLPSAKAPRWADFTFGSAPTEKADLSLASTAQQDCNAREIAPEPALCCFKEPISANWSICHWEVSTQCTAWL